MEQYQFPCGCYVLVEGNETTTKRCEEHKKKYPHRLDKEKK